MRERLTFDYRHLGFEHEISSVVTAVMGGSLAVESFRAPTLTTISLMESLAMTCGDAFSFEMEHE